jgi:hypothetical protein
MARPLCRLVLTALLIGGIVAAPRAHASDWGFLVNVSNTLNVRQGYLCQGGDDVSQIGCPTTAPYLTSGGLLGLGTANPQTALEVSGTVSATHYVGDGSGLTGVVASTGDRIVSGTTSMVAVSATGFVSLTQAGTNTGWFDPTRGLVTLGVSATGPVSATAAYLSGNLTAAGATLNTLGVGNITAAGTVTATSFVGTSYSGTNATLSGSLIVSGGTINSLAVGNLNASGDITTTGAIRAANFYGDGSHLTNISASAISGLSADHITSGTDAVTVYGGTHGISTTADLEVSGTVKVAGTGSEGCSTANIGTLRVNPVTKRLQICKE